MIVSQSESVAKAIAHFRAFSVDRTHTNRALPGFYNVTGVGLNYRMGEVQAALGCAQMDRVPEILRIRKENFNRLKNQLKIKGVEFVLDSTNSEQVNSHYCLVAVLDQNWAPRRNDILLKLKEEGVGTSIYYPQPVGRFDYYKAKYGYESKNFKNAERISDGSMALPVGPHLNSQDMDYIASKLAKIMEG
jgi:dTDP-4-amino-4,6-dideoxygalactose transaminase